MPASQSLDERRVRSPGRYRPMRFEGATTNGYVKLELLIPGNEGRLFCSGEAWFGRVENGDYLKAWLEDPSDNSVEEIYYEDQLQDINQGSFINPSVGYFPMPTMEGFFFLPKGYKLVIEAQKAKTDTEDILRGNIVWTTRKWSYHE